MTEQSGYPVSVCGVREGMYIVMMFNCMCSEENSEVYRRSLLICTAVIAGVSAGVSAASVITVEPI